MGSAYSLCVATQRSTLSQMFACSFQLYYSAIGNENEEHTKKKKKRSVKLIQTSIHNTHRQSLYIKYHLSVDGKRRMGDVAMSASRSSVYFQLCVCLCVCSLVIIRGWGPRCHWMEFSFCSNRVEWRVLCCTSTAYCTHTLHTLSSAYIYAQPNGLMPQKMEKNIPHIMSTRLVWNAILSERPNGEWQQQNVCRHQRKKIKCIAGRRTKNNQKRMAPNASFAGQMPAMCPHSFSFMYFIIILFVVVVRCNFDDISSAEWQFSDCSVSDD